MSSIDQRLRAAFGETDPEWERRTLPALARVRTRHRRKRERMKLAAVSLSAATVVTGLVLAPELSDRLRSSPTFVGAPNSDEPDVNLDGKPDVNLHGTWSTAPLTDADVRGTLRDTGPRKYTTAVLTALPRAPFRLVARFEAGVVSLQVRSSQRSEEIDHETYQLRGDMLSMEPGTGGRNEFLVVPETVASGTAIRLLFRSSTEPPTDGVPGEAWQRALWATAAFESSAPRGS
jgi:hypothetical protein